MQNRVHLLRDRHFDSAGASQSDRCLSGEHTFRDCAMHAGDDFGQFPPAAQFDANAAVARESSGAGEHQVAQTRESGHGLRDGRRRPLPDA